MTDQRAEWEIHKEESLTFIRSSPNSILFKGPNHQANFQLFLSTCKLEKLARDAREALAECIGYVPAWAREKHGMDAELARIDAILAKIKGAK